MLISNSTKEKLARAINNNRDSETGQNLGRCWNQDKKQKRRHEYDDNRYCIHCGDSGWGAANFVLQGKNWGPK